MHEFVHLGKYLLNVRRIAYIDLGPLTLSSSPTVTIHLDGAPAVEFRDPREVACLRASIQQGLWQVAPSITPARTWLRAGHYVLNPNNIVAVEFDVDATPRQDGTGEVCRPAHQPARAYVTAAALAPTHGGLGAPLRLDGRDAQVLWEYACQGATNLMLATTRW